MWGAKADETREIRGRVSSRKAHIPGSADLRPRLPAKQTGSRLPVVELAAQQQVRVDYRCRVAGAEVELGAHDAAVLELLGAQRGRELGRALEEAAGR